MSLSLVVGLAEFPELLKLQQVESVFGPASRLLGRDKSIQRKYPEEEAENRVFFRERECLLVCPDPAYESQHINWSMVCRQREVHARFDGPLIPTKRKPLGGTAEIRMEWGKSPSQSKNVLGSSGIAKIQIVSYVSRPLCNHGQPSNHHEFNVLVGQCS